jgi:glutathione synthase/RimK-type ligase-like ATP-grasp enzyme
MSLLKIALVTYEKLPDLSESDKILIPEFKKYNIEATAEVWDNPTVKWEKYDAIIIRNTWDYYVKFPEFVKWLDKLDALNIKVLNDLKIIRKNYHKFYLKELMEVGYNVIPTFFLDSKTEIKTSDLNNFNKMVLKPAVSAGSFQTIILLGDDLNPEQINSKTKEGDWLLQPFLPEILTEGEISLIFFGNEFSHSIIKKPSAGDFRVQKQFGGQYLIYNPEPELIEKLNPVFKTFGDEFLFGRIDGLMLNNTFHIMEIEMLEPDLYFDLFHEKAALFCEKAAQMIIS